MVDFTYRDGRVVVFHDECEMLWEEERRRPEGEPPPPGPHGAS
jgi:hypothetical protein